ncbi:hypothetical protein BE08_22270, partial [Sorangium cellulosum]
MLHDRTTPRSANMDIISLALLAAVMASAALLPACGAPPAEDLDGAGDAYPSERADAVAGPVKHRDPCAAVRCRDGLTCEVQGGLPVCVEAPPSRACQTDDDCSVAADYCGGCNCIALAPGESAPVCHGDEVACVVWPCLGLEARCEAGACVVAR